MNYVVVDIVERDVLIEIFVTIEKGKILVVMGTMNIVRDIEFERDKPNEKPEIDGENRDYNRAIDLPRKDRGRLLGAHG